MPPSVNTSVVVFWFSLLVEILDCPEMSSVCVPLVVPSVSELTTWPADDPTGANVTV